MNEYVLEAKKITKVYGMDTENEFEALHNIDFCVKPNEFICVMGPSGSGKSTFINNISTIDMPTKGSVRIQGVNLREMSAQEIGRFRYQNLGFVFQDFNLLDTHTLFENIAMPLSLAKVLKKDIQERVQSIALKMGIDHLLNKYPHECSGGQKQRAAICRALIANPKIIIADEPTGNLDSVNSHELLMTFKKLNEQENATIIMVSHDPMIASYSSRLIYIKDGKIEETVSREGLSQDEYFQRIVDINSLESRKLFGKDDV
ncbi:MAG: ABC transporter ATP-binding protein [Coprobacillus sp.]